MNSAASNQGHAGPTKSAWSCGPGSGSHCWQPITAAWPDQNSSTVPGSVTSTSAPHTCRPGSSTRWRSRICSVRTGRRLASVDSLSAQHVLARTILPNPWAHVRANVRHRPAAPAVAGARLLIGGFDDGIEVMPGRSHADAAAEPEALVRAAGHEHAAKPARRSGSLDAPVPGVGNSCSVLFLGSVVCSVGTVYIERPPDRLGRFGACLGPRRRARGPQRRRLAQSACDRPGITLSACHRSLRSGTAAPEPPVPVPPAHAQTFRRMCPNVLAKVILARTCCQGSRL